MSLMLQSLNFPSTVPELNGDSLQLRELTEHDIPAWFERATDAESAWLAGDPIPDSIEAGHRWLARHRERFQQRSGIRWAIVPNVERNQSVQSIGTVGLTITSKEDCVAEFGIVVARAWWRKGLGTAAARRVVRYAFDVLGVSEIRAELLASNVASKRLLENAGFQFVSAIPDFEQTDAGPVEGCLYVVRSAPRG